jgi:hypothetical protein
MKPEVDFLMRSLMEKLLIEVAPAIADGYLRSNVEVMAALMAASAEEYDRAAHVRAEENEAMRRIFRDAASFVPEVGLRERLEAAAAERDASLRVGDLNATNDRLRTLLIELHALVETCDESWARRTNRSIWEELRESANRRSISLWPL